MIRKEIVNPGRMRRMPEGFGWVDHRLVRKGYLKKRSRESLALYLFLVTVGDADGLSYYSEKKLSAQLNFTLVELATARKELVKAELVAYRKPFYQVLALPPTIEDEENLTRIITGIATRKSPERGNLCSLGNIMNSMIGGK